ncbi:hypothetical protein [Subtercola endophyticus]|uniref:hypothetical protein n=1 Tax=Subtercola endophyticus TaxID=2895559 RepID=UPI001E43F61A|nr:hypothetical protein [Subtercola endophyticus]UFS59121.1 hypothetical protein LQ955_19455 [Subtercola endophyticus]
MAATLKLTHKAIGVEVRRHPYDVVLDGQNAGSVTMNESIEIPISPGSHTVRIHSGRDSSKTVTFDAGDSEVIAYRCTGKRFLPLFLASFVDPDLALVLVPENEAERIGDFGNTP